MSEDRKIPAEAVDLYTRFIHGEISRRAFVSGVAKHAAAGLTTATLINALMPNYALGQQIAKDDERIRASYVTIPSPDGNGSIRGYLVRPNSADTRSATLARLPGVIVIHENRGLNPHTEDVARRFALENFMAFAPDTLTSLGGYPGDDYKGGQMFARIDRTKMTTDLVAAGYPAQEAELKKNNIRYEGHLWPNSVHGFFNDATPERYNKVTAPQAWARMIEWFNTHTRA